MTRIGVGGVLFHEDHVLLGKRSPNRPFYPGVWDIIGGHCIAGETTVETLYRELEEEIGIIPVEHRLLAVLPEPRPEHNGDGWYHVYLVTRWNGAPQNLRQDEHTEVTWIKIDEVDKLELAHPSYAGLFRTIRSLT